MYRIVKVDGAIRQSIDKTGVPNRYGEPKLFKTKKDRLDRSQTDLKIQ